MALTIFGGVCAFGLVAGLTATVIAARSALALSREATTYADDSANAILSGWNETALMNRGSSQFRADVAANGNFDAMFAQLRTLGSLKNYAGDQCGAEISMLAGRGKVVSARCAGEASFDNGTAQILISLIKESGKWRILGFWITPHAALGRPRTSSFSL
jgi:hypothetical protein